MEKVVTNTKKVVIMPTILKVNISLRMYPIFSPTKTNTIKDNFIPGGVNFNRSSNAEVK